ncbi:unnamed protein product [Knipowitschia caucasica]|uniref:Heart- and neural crest derivatives-expressed protein 1 n=1 Tax=Knipowitschia caucasica TaxID=637954 RepID=A0AAV2JA16_KNICA
MNVISGYHHHHHRLIHDPFPGPYFQSWVLQNHELPGDYHHSTEPLTPDPRFEALGGPAKRRSSAGPKKERRRTESINTAFAELRECIPNVPADTKLSKIKTLRLATSYITYLMEVLAKDGEAEGFKADLKRPEARESREAKRRRDLAPEGLNSYAEEKRVKGRTGWPQQVWALETRDLLPKHNQ